MTQDPTRIFWRALYFGLFLLAVFVLWMPSSAQAIEVDNESAAGYGSFVAKPGSPGFTGNIDLGYLNTKHPEIRTFSCVDSRNGIEITPAMRDALASVQKAAIGIFSDKFTPNDYGWGGSNDVPDGTDQKPNWGLGKHGEAMRKYLAQEKKLFRGTAQTDAGPRSRWSTYDDRELRGEPDGDDENFYYRWSPGVVVSLDKNDNRKESEIEEVSQSFPLSPEEGRLLAGYINSRASNYSNMWDGLPEGCVGADFDAEVDIGFDDLISNPIDFLVDLIFAVPNKFISSLYNAVYPNAFRWTFWTPHTERGDLMWQVSDNCQSQEAKQYCAGNVPLGFNKENIEDTKDRAFYLDVAYFLTWLTTSLYFVILFAAVVVFIFRGNRTQSFRLLQIGPRILLSILLTFGASFIIGSIISFANIAVMSIFDWSSTSGVAKLNMLLSMSGPLSGFGDALTSNIINLVVGGVATFSSIVLFFGAILRQLALIFLVIVAPIATFCIIVDAWREKFFCWLRGILIVAFLPVILALVLQIGMMVNPASMGGEDPGMILAWVGLGLLILIFSLMAWITKTGVSMAIFCRNRSLARGLSSAAGMAAVAAPALAETSLGSRFISQGAANAFAQRASDFSTMSGYVGDAAMVGDRFANFVPGGRESGASQASLLGQGVNHFTQGAHLPDMQHQSVRQRLLNSIEERYNSFHNSAGMTRMIEEFNDVYEDNPGYNSSHITEVADRERQNFQEIRDRTRARLLAEGADEATINAEVDRQAQAAGYVSGEALQRDARTGKYYVARTEEGYRTYQERQRRGVASSTARNEEPPSNPSFDPDATNVQAELENQRNEEQAPPV